MVDRPGTPWVSASGPGSVGVGHDSYGDISTTVVFGNGFERLDDALVDPTTMYEATDLTRFAGREWLTAAFDRFLRTQRHGFFLLESEAGLGKTTFAAWLSRERGYVSHLGQPEGTRSAATVRKNLAVQLIRGWGLDELAPDGVLPPTSVRPDWFAQVLSAAAHQRDRSEPETPIVLVIDGVDGIRNLDVTDGVGLPRRLPDGVYALATCRLGSRLYEYWQPFQSVVIRADSDENLRDMHEYLLRATREKRIQDALAGVDGEQMIRTLMARCAGVWIYLRFVLDEIRAGLRSPDDLESLPSDLWAFYAQNIAKLRHDERAWDGCYLPVLATLAAAREPLPLDLIRELCGDRARRSQVARFLGETFRPFCQASGVGTAPRYQLYHASLREFLLGRQPNRDVPRAGVLPLELRDAAHRAHQRIINRYLSAWGGLAQGLPALAARPEPGLIDDGYGLRHVVSHLDAANRYDDLHRLLGCVRATTSADGRQVRQHLWFLIRDHVGDHDGYLNDIEHARMIAAHTARTGLDEQPQLLGHAIRYSLILASFNSIAESISAQFAAVLVQAGLWSPKQAVAYARRVPRLADRARAYLRLAPHLDERQGAGVLHAAFEAATAIPAGAEQVEVISALAPQLSTATVMDEAIPFICRHSRGAHRIVMLDAMLAALPHAHRSTLARTLLHHHALTSTDAAERTEVLIGIAPYLSAPEAEVAGYVVQSADRAARIAMAVALSMHLPDHGERTAVGRDAVVSARSVLDPDRASEMLLRISGRMPPETLSAVAGGTIRLAGTPAWALIAQRTGASLTSAGVVELLNTMFVEQGTPQWISTLEALAPRIDAQTLPRVLALASQFSQPAQAQTLMRLAPHLPAPLRNTAAHLALGSTDPQARAVLMFSAGDGPTPHTTRALRDALTTISSINDGRQRDLTVNTLGLSSRWRDACADRHIPGHAPWLSSLSEEMAAMTRIRALSRLDADATRVAGLGHSATAEIVAAIVQVGEWFP